MCGSFLDRHRAEQRGGGSRLHSSDEEQPVRLVLGWVTMLRNEPLRPTQPGHPMWVSHGQNTSRQGNFGKGRIEPLPLAAEDGDSNLTQCFGVPTSLYPLIR